MTATKIEWATHVWNPVTGRTKVSEGCRHCYAETIAKRFWGDRRFGDVVCHEDRLDQPLRWRKRRPRVFVNSMSDLFHEDVPEDFIHSVFSTMHRAHRDGGHNFLVLTKRPQRMATVLGPDGIGWYAANGPVPRPEPGIWLGVSVEDQATADERIPLLLQTPAAVRFVSVEPMLGPVDLSPWLVDHQEHGIAPGRPAGTCVAYTPPLDWVICGGESGPKARPMHPEWARSLRDQCQAAGEPFFMKQMAKREEIPDDLMIREFPS